MHQNSKLVIKTKIIHKLLALMTVCALMLATSCSSDSDSETTPDSPASETDSELAAVSRILNIDSMYTIDDYLSTGWKKSKQYDDISTVPEATEVYFGFFNAKDIEIRIYPSHESAKTAGITDASEDIDQSFREGGQYGASNRGAGSSAVTKFKAFAVVGNTVLLCEQSVDYCTDLVDALGQ